MRIKINSPGRLIQEKKQLGLRSQLNTDSQQLALLDIQTLARNTDNGFRKLLHFQHSNDILDVIVLLLDRDRRGLTQHSTETKRFAYSCSVKVKILLLDIASLPLETVIELTTIDEHITGNDSHGSPVG